MLLSACSHHQEAQLGLRSSSVNAYPQNMNNMQLCETLYYHRASNQTRAAIGAEFNRRRLNKSWCHKAYNATWLDALVTKIQQHEKQENADKGSDSTD